MGEAALNKGVFGRRESPAEIDAPKEPPVEPFQEGKMRGKMSPESRPRRKQLAFLWSERS